MGKSKSISAMEKKEAAFAAWIAQKKAELEANEKDLQTAQDKQIEAFYDENNWKDSKIIASGSNTDFQHEADFSMANLKAVIDQIGSALFEGGASPGGTSTDPTEAKAAVDAAKAMGTEAASAATIGLYVASKVFDILSGVLMSFGTTTKLAYSHTFKSQPLGFGMHLFCTVAASSIQQKDFFNDEYIFEYLYIYEVRFSESQAKEEGKQDLVKQYENAIAAFETRLDNLDQEVASGKLTGEEYESASAIWTQLVDKNEKELQAMKAEMYRAR